MHRPPAVSYPVVRSRWHLVAVVVLSFLDGAATADFALQQDARLLISALFWCWIPIGFFALRSCLHWDGQLWQVKHAGISPAAQGSVGPSVQRVQVAMDFQQVLLVRVTSYSGATAWRWLDHGTAPVEWQWLWRALVDYRKAGPRKASAAKLAAIGEP